MMNLIDTLHSWPRERIASLYAAVTPDTVQSALARENHDIADLIALFSPQPFRSWNGWRPRRIASLALKFGRTINLYAPIYLSNVWRRTASIGFRRSGEKAQPR